MGGAEHRAQRVRGFFGRLAGIGIGQPSVEGDAITPLTSEQRLLKYPYVIFELKSHSPFERALMLAVHETMAGPQFPIAVDREKNLFRTKTVIRTNTLIEEDRVVQSALFLGLTGATRRRLGTSDEVADAAEVPYVSEYRIQAASVARELFEGLTSKPELFKAFRDYCRNPNSSTCQGEFQKQLLVYGTDFDPDFLDKNLAREHLHGSMIQRGTGFPSLPRPKGWQPITLAETFEKYPDTDYHRLEDEEFRATPEGQDLLKEYAKICGRILASRNDSGPIPLSKHPIIEALITNIFSKDHPDLKARFYNTDLADLVLHSDSQPAHDSLIDALLDAFTRTDQKRVIDRETEGLEEQTRSEIIRFVLWQYGYSRPSDPVHNLLRRDFTRIMEAFTKNGVIAKDIREENERLPEDWTINKKIHEVKGVVMNLIRVGLVSPDPEISAEVEALIAGYLYTEGDELAQTDKLALSRNDLKLALLDALDNTSTSSRLQILERSGVRVFGDTEIGKQLKGLIEIKNEEMLWIRNAPEADFTRTKHKEFMENYRHAKNQLLLFLLGQSTNDADFFAKLVSRVEFIDTDTHELPSVYYGLIDLANNPNITEEQRDNILQQIRSEFGHAGTETTHLLFPVMLDMFQVVLGPPDAVRMPTGATWSGIRAATHIVRDYGGHSAFVSASQDQLQTLADYKKGIRARAEQIAGVPPSEEIMYYLDRIMNGIEWLENIHKEYLQVEAARVHPHIYYPWLLEPFLLYFKKVRWENKRLQDEEPFEPRSRGVDELYKDLEYLVRNKLVFRKPEDYAEDFDPIEEGCVDLLIKELYEHIMGVQGLYMNTTASTEGTSLMQAAVACMPPTLLEQIIAKYKDTPFAKFLETTHEKCKDTALSRGYNLQKDDTPNSTKTILQRMGLGFLWQDFPPNPKPSESQNTAIISE